MLHKSHISNIEIYTPEWDRIRKGRLTSSRIVSLLTEKPLGTGAMSYIYQKAGERVTGYTLADDNEVIIEDENTIWGLENEPKALQLFGQAMKLKYLVVQKIIFDPASMESSTPDALWIMDTSVIKEDCYNVATVEVKCPRKYHTFFPLFACDTPEKLKRHERKYYWQVIDQMDNCDSAIGYFAAFHPLYPKGCDFRQIQFKKLELWDEFKKLTERKKQANELLLKWKSEFMTA